VSDEKKWNERYLNNDTPWETGIHHPEMERLFSQYVNKGQTVLEVGCGSGINAKWLYQAGYKVTAIDLSAEAIKLATNHSNYINFLCMDFLKDEGNLPYFSTVFDCAVLQVLNGDQRLDFVKSVAAHCEKDGYWINISCSKDEAQIIENQKKIKAPPYLTAEKIITIVEPFFEIIEMKRCDFPIDRRDSGSATFNAWGCVFKKR
jgi:2-polyprenyl-3-methyl-5-hydroxy-6-metoxy-1,4-benzoquinol methylase